MVIDETVNPTQSDFEQAAAELQARGYSDADLLLGHNQQRIVTRAEEIARQRAAGETT